MMPRPVIFVAVGGVAAAVHLGLVYLLVERTGLTPLQANILAFLGAFVVSFCGHYQLTYGGQSAPVSSLRRWLAISIASFAANQLMYGALLQHFGGAAYMMLLLIVTGTVAVLSYCLGKLWAFAPGGRA
jgi:putative flippase GtrA